MDVDPDRAICCNKITIKKMRNKKFEYMKMRNLEKISPVLGVGFILNVVVSNVIFPPTQSSLGFLDDFGWASERRKFILDEIKRTFQVGKKKKKD